MIGDELIGIIGFIIVLVLVWHFWSPANGGVKVVAKGTNKVVDYLDKVVDNIDVDGAANVTAAYINDQTEALKLSAEINKIERAKELAKKQEALQKALNGNKDLLASIDKANNKSNPIPKKQKP